MKNRVFVLIGFVLLAVLVVWISSKNRSGIFETDDSYTRAQVARMLVLAVESQDNIDEAMVSGEWKDIKEDDWYAKYVSEAVRLGFMKGDSDAEKFSPKEPFTYKDAGILMEQEVLSKEEFSFSHSSGNAMKTEDFRKVYEALLAQYGEDALVKKEHLYIYACNEEEESLVTNNGTYRSTGMDLSEYKGRCVTLYCQKQICAALCGSYEGTVELPNVWCQSADTKGLEIYSQGIQSRLSGELKETAQYNGVIADVTMKEDRIAQVQVKTEQVTGKVIAVSDTQMEVEGAGTYEVAASMPVYRVYDTVREESARNILLGYEEATLVLDQGQVVAALLKKAARSQNIRVLLNTTGFASPFHQSVKITCDEAYTVTAGDTVRNYDAGETVSFRLKSKLLKKGRVTVRPASQDGALTLTSVERGYGNPVYHGSLELSLTDEGICVVNDTGLETYLYAVVPSEMPVSYGSEALKVQAVCARSYAYSQILNSSYGEYGAHLDDSVSSQVYNNSKECSESIQAVDATCGQVLFFGDEVASTYFFSTSCGYTGNSSDVWLNGGKTPEYLTGQLQAEETAALQLNEEQAFQEFIDAADAYDFYEKDSAWFRWTVTMNQEQIQQAVDTNLASVSKYVKVCNQKGKYVSREISSIGKVKNIEVQLRSTSGVIKRLLVTGSKAKIQVNSEYAVRKLLGNQNVELTLRDGSRSRQSMLPSGYFYITRSGSSESAQYAINGGGYGHGVGMSQNGVQAMGQRGYSFTDILTHYFPGTQLQNIY